jgi:hypothetical protein
MSPLIVVCWFQSDAIPCGICGEQSGPATAFTQSKSGFFTSASLQEISVFVCVLVYSPPMEKQDEVGNIQTNNIL